MALHFEVGSRLERGRSLGSSFEPPSRFEAHHPWGPEPVAHRSRPWNPSAAVLPLQQLPAFAALPTDVPQHALLQMKAASPQLAATNVSTFFDPEFNAEAIRRHANVLTHQHTQGGVPQVLTHAAGQAFEALDLASNATAFLSGSAPSALALMGLKNYVKPSLGSVARSTERFLLQDAPNYLRARYNDAFLFLYKLKHQLPIKDGRLLADELNTVYRDTQQVRKAITDAEWRVVRLKERWHDTSRALKSASESAQQQELLAARQELSKNINQWSEYLRFNKALLEHNQNYLQQLKAYAPPPP